MNSRRFQPFGQIVRSVDTTEKVVALTFDDGPTPHTDRVLAALEQADIRATFFLNGRDIAQHPEETRKLVDAGHELGNHSYSHARMVFRSPAFIRNEIVTTDELIRRSGYLGDIHFRPPYGKKLVVLPYYLMQRGTTTIMWNIEPDSYAEVAADARRIVAHVEDAVTPGSIILLHVMHDTEARASLEAIGGIAAALHARGYEFVTVSELLAYQD